MSQCIREIPVCADVHLPGMFHRGDKAELGCLDMHKQVSNCMLAATCRLHLALRELATAFKGRWRALGHCHRPFALSPGFTARWPCGMPLIRTRTLTKQANEHAIDVIKPRAASVCHTCTQQTCLCLQIHSRKPVCKALNMAAAMCFSTTGLPPNAAMLHQWLA